MAGKNKDEKDRKKPAATSSKRSAAPKKTGRTSANSKTKATPKTAETPKKTKQTAAKAKTTAKSKSTPKKEPKPPAKVMKELKELAQKHGGGQANVSAKPAPKVNASRSGETRVVPKNGVLKEVTVKYKFN